MPQSMKRVWQSMMNGPAILAIKDATSGVHLDVSESFERVFQRKQEDVIGKTAEEVFGGERGSKMRAHDNWLMAHRESGAVWTGIEDAPHPDGSTLFFQVQKWLFEGEDASGRPVLYIGLCAVDVTPTKRDAVNHQEVAQSYRSVYDCLPYAAWLSDGGVNSPRDPNALARANFDQFQLSLLDQVVHSVKDRRPLAGGISNYFQLHLTEADRTVLTIRPPTLAERLCVLRWSSCRNLGRGAIVVTCDIRT